MPTNNLLYASVKQNIIENIDSKKYKTYEKIPSEKKLCELYSVSRITVRKAIKELVCEGLLITYQGKGTFVLNHKIENELLEVGGFTDFGKHKQRVTKQTTISCNVVSSAYHCLQLNIDKNTKLFRLLRLMWLDNEPLFIDCSHIPLSRYPNFDNKYQKGSSTYALLDSEYNTLINKDKKIISVKMAGSFESKHLNCSLGEPLFFIKKVAYDNDNIPVHTSELYCCANRVSLTIHNTK